MRHAQYLAAMHVSELASLAVHVAFEPAHSRLDEVWLLSKIAVPAVVSLVTVHLSDCCAANPAEYLDSQAVQPYLLYVLFDNGGSNSKVLLF